MERIWIKSHNCVKLVDELKIVQNNLENIYEIQDSNNTVFQKYKDVKKAKLVLNDFYRHLNSNAGCVFVIKEEENL